MRLCINPDCDPCQVENLDTATSCDRCGCQLLIDDKYAVTKLLSDKSGFGTIYELVDCHSESKVLKVLKPEFNDEQRTVALFQQEAYLLQQIDAPTLPKIDAYIHHELPNDRVLHGIIMEKIAGSNLQEWLKARDNEPIADRMAIDWLRKIVETLDVVHQKNYFHRDIKPSNIMIQPSGALVLIDFGSARHESYTYMDKLYGKGGITQIASAGYTPPEQERGFAVPQSDFYALGMTFIHLVTGKYPLNMYDPSKNLYQWRAHAPQITPALADLLDHLIAIPPIDRPIDCASILRCLDEIEFPAPATSIPAPAATPFSMLPWIGLLILTVGAIGYTIAAALGILFSPERSQPANSHARECVKDPAANANCRSSGQPEAHATNPR